MVRAIKDSINIASHMSQDRPGIRSIHLIDYEGLLKTGNLADVARTILESSYTKKQFMQKDDLDRFIDFVYLKIQNGFLDVFNLAYPTKRMNDPLLESRIMELINVHLNPEIVLPILKYFTRNVHNSDINIYLANLLTDEGIITAIFDTYQLFKRDIFTDPEKKTLNVKRIQQFSAHSENKYSSPLDAACRLKYVLEFLSMKHSLGHLITKESLMISNIPA